MLMDKTMELALDQAGIVAYLDQFGNYLYVNKGWSSATGISREKAVGRNVEELLVGSSAMLAIRTGRTISGEMFLKTVGGRELSGIMKYQPVKDDKKEVIGCFVSSIFDNLDEAQYFAGMISQIMEEFDYYENSERSAASAKYGIDSIIGVSRAVKELKEQIYIAGASNSPCLIEGETGTGKELVAHAIHNVSRRRIFPFVRVNCSAIPENLMESEFFGYEEGSFAGGLKGGRAGKFEKAHLGSMFLDEINALNLMMQPKLLRAIQEKEIERIGSVESIPVNVRVISASNRSLEKMADQELFRRDLLYRLNIITISIPPLRERKEDIYPLAQHFISKFNSESLGYVSSISDEAVEYLMSYDWPGNIRELQNTIERAMALTWSERLEANHFRKYMAKYHIHQKVQINGMTFNTPKDRQRVVIKRKRISPKNTEVENMQEEYSIPREINTSFSENIASLKADNDLTASLKELKDEREKEAILDALEASGHNKAKAARMLNISRTLLYKKLAKYNIS